MRLAHDRAAIYQRARGRAREVLRGHPEKVVLFDWMIDKAERDLAADVMTSQRKAYIDLGLARDFTRRTTEEFIQRDLLQVWGRTTMRHYILGITDWPSADMRLSVVEKRCDLWLRSREGRTANLVYDAVVRGCDTRPEIRGYSGASAASVKRLVRRLCELGLLDAFGSRVVRTGASPQSLDDGTARLSRVDSVKADHADFELFLDARGFEFPDHVVRAHEPLAGGHRTPNKGVAL